ncbi:MAG TPA: 50S ribosomal protein L10 [Solirubrobacterales bacterium]|nr:50S ribosomal protein L10 [Solirubrobacterales bacterium]
MNREEKAALVEEIGAEIESSEAIFAVDYRGISVTQAAELRNGLREADASFKVVKNRLTKIAAEKAGVTELNELLQGPTALTFVKGDTAAAAKAITSFNKEHEVLTYKGGVMGDTILDEGRFTAISKLPSRDVLNGQLAGIVASPLVTLTRGLGSMISGLAIALQQVADQGLVGGSAEAAPAAEEESAAEEAPAEEPAAEEAPAEEAEAPAEEAPEAEAEAPAEEEAAEPAAEEEAPAEEATDGAEAEESESETNEAPAEEATDGADAKE